MRTPRFLDTTQSQDWALVAGLALLATLAPLPLYLVALAVFGLPHVIWELAWIRRVSAGRLPRLWWRALFAFLAIQALGRLALLLDWIGADLAIAVDLVTLAFAVGLVVGLPRLVRWARAVALMAALGLGAIGLWGSLETSMAALVALALAHNFTPVGLQAMAPPTATESHLALPAMFVLPFALLLLPEVPSLGAWPSWPPGELAWLGEHLPWDLPGLFSALVLAQVLHYLAVIRILPRRIGSAWSSASWLTPALIVSAVLALGFLASFPDARRVYAVAAGFHAWLEWPILLALLGAVERRR
ncbi:MAG: hypothetical protein FJX47_01310 [Alphaproteobacteria bacterium]|nr:hypothetical protein [Alphaproteobacteria bacterium]